MSTTVHEPVLDFDIAAGDHVCAMYSGPAERNAILRAFLDAGVERRAQ